jgi:hypothetical protein
MSKPCIIKNCKKTVSDRSQFAECHSCRSRYHYWKKQRPDQLVQRQENLEKFQDRMLHMAAYPQWKRRTAKVAAMIKQSTRGNGNGKG